MTTDTPFPLAEDIVSYIENADSKVTRRDLANAFGIKGEDRVALKTLLREMVARGMIARGPGKGYELAGQMPNVSIVYVTGISESGSAFGFAEAWKGDGDGPRVRLEDFKKGGRQSRQRPSSLAAGDKVLARLRPAGDKGYRGQIIKKLDAPPRAMVGVYRHDGEGGFIESVEKGRSDFLLVASGDDKGAEDGELVRAEVLRSSQRGAKVGKVLERLGDVLGPRNVSLIAIHQHDIPNDFPSEVVQLAETAVMPPLGAREDLRDVPLITIDPADARDHDDAIWAAPHPNIEGGFHAIVAIADVAEFVRPGSALDKEARKRGNSCYFPDRVVPMLPEALSNGLCSLKEGEDRASLAVHLYFDALGRLKSHRFSRALIKVAANISYEQAQAAFDGDLDDATKPLIHSVLRPLLECYNAIASARDKRGPLALDLPEKKILLGPDGKVSDVRLRDRLTAHRVVEDMMIAANVAAAEALEKKAQPLIYRVHEEPSMDKMETLRSFLDGFDYKLARGQVVRPQVFNRVLEMSKEREDMIGVSDMVLRTQMQARYTPENMGHFGLALGRYAHFTSPIRRYADLVVHRALIAAYKLGEGGLEEWELQKLDDTADHISVTERRAMAAERDSMDRYLAAYFADHQGEHFEARITGIAKAGLFLRVGDMGADAFAPAARLSDEYMVYDETRQALVGERSGWAYRLGDEVRARIEEAAPVSGGVRVSILTKPKHRFLDGPSKRKRPNSRPQQGRPKNVRLGRRRR
ncbi:MAG: ribonuclease R [Pseudomonadota bacterium]